MTAKRAFLGRSLDWRGVDQAKSKLQIYSPSGYQGSQFRDKNWSKRINLSTLMTKSLIELFSPKTY